MSQSYDAIVIGAGVIGSAVGLELARSGMRTLNIDRCAAPGDGSTSASCAIIRVYYSTIDGTALAYESLHHWREWAKHLGIEPRNGLARFRECGTLVMKTASNDYGKPSMAMMRQLDIPFEEWSTAKICERLPGYKLDCFAPARRVEDDGFGKSTGTQLTGGVFFPGGGYVNDPRLAASNLRDAAEHCGGSFRFNENVVAIPQANGRVAGVELANGELIRAPIVVNVAGPHSGIINAMAGVLDDMSITTKPLRHEVVHVPAPEGFDLEARGCVVSDSDIAVYVRPETGGKLALGSENPSCDPIQLADPDDFERSLTEQGLLQAYRYAQRLPDLPIPLHPKGVADLYDVTEDWIPIYDRSSLPGFYMAIGTSGNQFKNAPVAGKLMAHLIAACEDGHDHDASPLSYPLKHVDHALDLATFSRRRTINADSSFSVLG